MVTVLYKCFGLSVFFAFQVFSEVFVDFLRVPLNVSVNFEVVAVSAFSNVAVPSREDRFVSAVFVQRVATFLSRTLRFKSFSHRTSHQLTHIGVDRVFLAITLEHR